jgi:NAD dependent epimerase/dehydratase family
MRVFVAGASGAIGTRLVPQLLEAGHEVTGTSRSPRNAERIRALGAEPVVLDLLDPGAVRRAVLETEPDAIVHQATALADAGFSRKPDRTLAETNRLRREGTEALLSAAAEAGVSRLLAQSFVNLRYARVGGPVKSEEDPLDPAPVAGMGETVAALSYLEEAVTGAGGIVLRYGISAPATTGCSSPCASGASRSSVRAAASPPSSSSRTPPPRPCSPSNRRAPRSTMSSTTSPPRCASGCRCSRRRSEPSRPATSRSGSRGSSRARPRSCSEPPPAAPPTRRPSASSAGRFATPAGVRASRRCTRSGPRREPRRSQRLRSRTPRTARDRCAAVTEQRSLNAHAELSRRGRFALCGLRLARGAGRTATMSRAAPRGR